MQQIIKPRMSGKTTEIIKLSAETGKYIVCANRQQVSVINSMAKEMNLDIPFPVTFQEIIDGDYRGSSLSRDGVYVDNLDDIIRILIKNSFQGIDIKGYSMTEGNIF